MRSRMDRLPNDASGNRRTSAPCSVSRRGYTSRGFSYPRPDAYTRTRWPRRASSNATSAMCCPTLAGSGTNVWLTTRTVREGHSTQIGAAGRHRPLLVHQGHGDRRGVSRGSRRLARDPLERPAHEGRPARERPASRPTVRAPEDAAATRDCATLIVTRVTGLCASPSSRSRSMARRSSTVRVRCLRFMAVPADRLVCPEPVPATTPSVPRNAGRSGGAARNTPLVTTGTARGSRTAIGRRNGPRRCGAGSSRSRAEYPECH